MSHSKQKVAQALLKIGVPHFFFQEIIQTPYLRFSFLYQKHKPYNGVYVMLKNYSMGPNCLL